MMAKVGSAAGIAAILTVTVVAFSSLYTVKETEQVIITQFGEPRGEPVTAAGLKFKLPFIQKVNRIEKRILEWDGRASEMPTKAKDYIIVDTYARWQITDPLSYFQRLRDERSALSRLDDILGSETRNTIAKHDLIEVVRSTKDRVPAQSEELMEADRTGTVGSMKPIRRGRVMLEEEIFEKSRGKLSEFGIELLDVRFKRINYNQSVRERIYERMVSERQQIANRFRSEGDGEAAKILGNMQRDLRVIESEAYKEVQTIKGEADAKAAAIYAGAFNENSQSAEFYEFVRTMEVYSSMLAKEGTIVLSTDSEIYKYLKSIEMPRPRNQGISN
ncbi:MAG: protease modulator HflC [Verrucomicrobiota bacterium]